MFSKDMYAPAACQDDGTRSLKGAYAAVEMKRHEAYVAMHESLEQGRVNHCAPCMFTPPTPEEAYDNETANAFSEKYRWGSSPEFTSTAEQMGRKAFGGKA